MGQWTSVASNRHVNELRVQMGREVRPRTYQGEGPQVTVGNIGMYGPPSSGAWVNVGFASEDNRYHLVDSFSRRRRSHNQGRHLPPDTLSARPLTAAGRWRIFGDSTVDLPWDRCPGS